MLLQIEELTKVYRTGTRANDGISLAIGEGEVFGLLGHNGAGKTTLVNQVVGLLRPTSGTIRIDGRDMVADPGLARRLCSSQAQAQVPIDGLTPRQAIDLLGQLRLNGVAALSSDGASRLTDPPPGAAAGALGCRHDEPIRQAAGP
ncbi:MAG TPA: ATP-binding cassette domain-containing protein [Candidatus Limnocylindrales bacterium]